MQPNFIEETLSYVPAFFLVFSKSLCCVTLLIVLPRLLGKHSLKKDISRYWKWGMKKFFSLTLVILSIWYLSYYGSPSFNSISFGWVALEIPSSLPLNENGYPTLFCSYSAGESTMIGMPFNWWLMTNERVPKNYNKRYAKRVEPCSAYSLVNPLAKSLNIIIWSGLSLAIYFYSRREQRNRLFQAATSKKT